MNRTEIIMDCYQNLLLKMLENKYDENIYNEIRRIHRDLVENMVHNNLKVPYVSQLKELGCNF